MKREKRKDQNRKRENSHFRVKKWKEGKQNRGKRKERVEKKLKNGKETSRKKRKYNGLANVQCGYRTLDLELCLDPYGARPAPG